MARRVKLLSRGYRRTGIPGVHQEQYLTGTDKLGEWITEEIQESRKWFEEKSLFSKDQKDKMRTDYKTAYSVLSFYAEFYPDALEDIHHKDTVVGALMFFPWFALEHEKDMDIGYALGCLGPRETRMLSVFLKCPNISPATGAGQIPIMPMMSYQRVRVERIWVVARG